MTPLSTESALRLAHLCTRNAFGYIGQVCLANLAAEQPTAFLTQERHAIMANDPQVSLRILVIDDDPSLTDLISDALSLLGKYTVSVARNGEAGLEAITSFAPDCVVVDVRMPNLSGYQVVRALRGDPTTAQTPIIMLSALTQDRDKLIGMMSGADAYLVKPIKMADLLAAIKRALRLSSESRQQRQRQLADDN